MWDTMYGSTSVYAYRGLHGSSAEDLTWTMRCTGYRTSALILTEELSWCLRLQCCEVQFSFIPTAYDSYQDCLFQTRRRHPLHTTSPNADNPVEKQNLSRKTIFHQRTTSDFGQLQVRVLQTRNNFQCNIELFVPFGLVQVHAN